MAIFQIANCLNSAVFKNYFFYYFINSKKLDKLQVGGNNINEIQKNILEKVGIESNDIIRYEAYIRNNLKIHNQKSSFLDVISLTDSFKIVKYCWTSIFSKYFDNKTYDKLENQFDKCSEARNPVAHGHEEYLTKLDQQEIDVSCKQIFELLAKAQYPPSPSEKEIIDTAKKYIKFINNNVNNIVKTINNSIPQICNLVTKEVEFYVKELGAQGKNLSGSVIIVQLDNNKTCQCNATIRKNTLPQGIDLYDMIGKKVKVEIDEVSPQGDRYLCRYKSMI